MDKIEFKIKLSIGDLYYFMMNHYYTKFSGIFGLILSAAAAVILVVRFSQLESMAKILLFIVAILFSIVNPIMLWTKTAAQIAANKSLGGELTYKLDEEGITVCLGEAEALVSWEEVVRVKDNGRELVAYVTHNRGYIWPKRQLENYDQVLAIVKANVTAERLKLKEA